MSRLSMEVFFLKDTAPAEIFPLSLHDALPISAPMPLASLIRDRYLSGVARGWGDIDWAGLARGRRRRGSGPGSRSEEHTSELQSQSNVVCRLLLEKKNTRRSPYAQYVHAHTLG